MAPTYLDEIVSWHRARARDDRREWRSRVDEAPYRGPSFAQALRRPTVQVIAEVKRRSPSKGNIGPDLDPAALARSYQAGGAAAISVLTDTAFFAGSTDDLRAVHDASSLPLLRKDFTVAENDVLDARDMGAAAVLLIVSVLSDDELLGFLEVARLCGLDALVEVHDEHEARRAIACGAHVIGVNQRDLHTFAVDPTRAGRVGAMIPSSHVAVAESGLSTREDVERAASDGFDAVLIGEALVRHAHPQVLLGELASIESRSRG